ncbi:unnamed protein product [Ostreobium quekettii]|uniref:SWI/SNF-related matrix-associated actin-dependent regulator of chromatin subfamily A-like protein 1 n=1 Tax=Ostreobium quekettii TaxID=121088 RepID=A0A8S1J1H8_9CHLO|nr:unnamed protein product [Ostreobium quekettii]|eukprot:evm.model.scf_852EXC.3 EVM.evm.TU.scf_852EXC.3   scf_852EXC:9620-20024(-)
MVPGFDDDDDGIDWEDAIDGLKVAEARFTQREAASQGPPSQVSPKPAQNCTSVRHLFTKSRLQGPSVATRPPRPSKASTPGPSNSSYRPIALPTLCPDQHQSHTTGFLQGGSVLEDSSHVGGSTNLNTLRASSSKGTSSSGRPWPGQQGPGVSSSSTPNQVRWSQNGSNQGGPHRQLPRSFEACQLTAAPQAAASHILLGKCASRASSGRDACSSGQRWDQGPVGSCASPPNQATWNQGGSDPGGARRTLPRSLGGCQVAAAPQTAASNRQSGQCANSGPVKVAARPPQPCLLYSAWMKLEGRGQLCVKFSGYHEQLAAACMAIPGARPDAWKVEFRFPVEQYSTAMTQLGEIKGVQLKVHGLEELPRRILEVAAKAQDESHHYDSLPEHFESQLLGFQRTGVKFALKHGGRVLIGDEMGLGKTIQALAVARAFEDEWPVLVVCPSSLREQWADAICRWLKVPADGVVVGYKQADAERQLRGASRRNLQFAVVSYELVTRVQELLLAVGFGVVVLDEAHMIKSPKAARTKACIPIVQKTKRAVLLSGTPALSRPFELFEQLRCLLPGAKLKQLEYAERYCMGDRFSKYKGSKNEEELNAVLMASVMIRRRKQDVLSELPAKTRQQIYLSLTEEEKGSLVAMNKKRDAVTDMIRRLVQQGTPESELKAENNQALNEYYTETAKLKVRAVQAYVNDLLEADDKFLIFAHHKDLINGIEKALNRRKASYIRIDGETPPHKRDELKNRFQEDSSVRAAVLAIRAAGVGLNFSSASLVIFAELTWVPGEVVQCEDRAHRIGQASAVTVQFLLVKNSIDDIIWQTLSTKLNSVGHVLDGQHQSLRVQSRTNLENPGQANLTEYLRHSSKEPRPGSSPAKPGPQGPLAEGARRGGPWSGGQEGRKRGRDGKDILAYFGKAEGEAGGDVKSRKVPVGAGCGEDGDADAFL